MFKGVTRINIYVLTFNFKSKRTNILIFVYNKLYRYEKHETYKFNEVDIIKFAINFVWQMSDYWYTFNFLWKRWY